MSGRWPEDVEPAEIPSLNPWVSPDGHSLNSELPGYPGGRSAFDRYFETYADPMYGWLARRKWRVQILSITYGGKLITEPSVKERFYNALRDYNEIQITNDNLGGDPQSHVPKEFVIEYRNVNNDDNRFLKRRKMLESETLDFGWDITKLMYGANPLVWSLDRFPKAFENLFWALDHQGDVEISYKNLDCDPAPAQRKSLQIAYGSSKHSGDSVNIGDGSRLRFSARWG